MEHNTLKTYEHWKGSNGKLSARWQHVSQLKASAFCIWKNKLWCFKTQELILGTGTAILWMTEPHCWNTRITSLLVTSCGQNSNIHIGIVYFFDTAKI